MGYKPHAETGGCFLVQKMTRSTVFLHYFCFRTAHSLRMTGSPGTKTEKRETEKAAWALFTNGASSVYYGAGPRTNGAGLVFLGAGLIFFGEPAPQIDDSCVLVALVPLLFSDLRREQRRPAPQTEGTCAAKC